MPNPGLSDRKRVSFFQEPLNQKNHQVGENGHSKDENSSEEE
jgi:hypothetical protein